MKAVFFDAVGTLIFLPQSVGHHYQEVAAEFDVALSVDDLNKAFRLAWAAAPPRTAVKGPREEDDKGWWRMLVGEVLQQILGKPEAASLMETGYFDAVYAHFAQPQVWQVFDDVPDTLRDLQARRLSLGVISNFDRRLHTILKGLDLTRHFEVIIVSSEVGADKPDRFIFETALKSLNISGREAIHCGDDPARDAGATEVGMRFYRVQRPKQDLHHLTRMLDGPANR